MDLLDLFSRSHVLYVLLTLLAITARGMEHGNCGGACCAANPGFTAPDPAAMEFDGGQSATSDRSAGIGIEYESAYIQFESETAKKDPDPGKTFQSKGKIVNGLKGPLWELTADDLGRPGVLDAEIVLDGKVIKPGTGDLGRAAHEAILELQKWNPSVQSPDRRVKIESSPFNDWIITDPPRRNGVNSVAWAPQVTVPMPLEAIQWLIGQGDDPRIFMYKPGRNQVKVLPGFFKTNPGGVTQNDIQNRPDVLGFFSIILTYAKAARELRSTESPKIVSKIMPRTDFTTIFQTQGFSRVIPREHLYDIVKALACFKNTGGDNYELDQTYCTGSFDRPMPNDRMDKQTWKIGDQGQPLTIHDWMQTITDGTVPDGLTTLDKQVDSSIGGLDGALENVHNTNRAVPIFEFRGLGQLETWELVKFANAVERNVLDLHHQFATAPRRHKKRTSKMRSPLFRRGNETVDNACPVGCVLCDVSAVPLSASAFYSNATSRSSTPKTTSPSTDASSSTKSPSNTPTTSSSSTDAPSSTISPSSAPTTSSSSTDAPSSTISPSSAPTVPPSSTAAPSPSSIVSKQPTCTVWLSKEPISIGNANEQDNGRTLRQKSFDAIKQHCPPSPASCDSTLATVDDVWTLVGGYMQELTIQYEVQASNYSDDKTFNTMLDAGLSSWQQFSTKSCKQVPKMFGREQGCDTSDPLKRDLANLASVEERTIGDGQIHYPCKSGGTICSAPDHISVVLEGSDGNLYNHLEIDVSIKMDGEDGISKFICELLIDGVGALAMAVFPELAEVDLIGEVELSSLCK